MTDKDIAGDLLGCVKHMSMGYMTAILKSQDPTLRGTFKTFHDQCMDNQQRVF